MCGRKTSPITGKHHILQDVLYLSCFNCIELTCRSRPPSVVGRCALFFQMIFQHLAYRFVFNYSPSIFFPRLLSYFMCTAVSREDTTSGNCCPFGFLHHARTFTILAFPFACFNLCTLVYAGEDVQLVFTQ